MLGFQQTHANDGGFIARHGIMGEQGNEQDFLHALGPEFFHGGFNGRILIAHRQLDRNVNAFLQKLLNVPAADNQR